MTQEKQLYPQWAINECLLNGALPNGYQIQVADLGRDFVKGFDKKSGIGKVSGWEWGARVWIDHIDKEHYRLTIYPSSTSKEITSYTLPYVVS